MAMHPIQHSYKNPEGEEFVFGVAAYFPETTAWRKLRISIRQRKADRRLFRRLVNRTYEWVREFINKRECDLFVLDWTTHRHGYVIENNAPWPQIKSQIWAVVEDWAMNPTKPSDSPCPPAFAPEFWDSERPLRSARTDRPSLGTYKMEGSSPFTSRLIVTYRSPNMRKRIEQELSNSA